MAQKTNTYKFHYLQYGDKWYPGYDYDNMQTVENQFAYLYKFIGGSVGTGWTVQKLSDNRADQLNLISAYTNNPLSEDGQQLTNLNLNFLSNTVCAAGTTQDVALSGGAPNSLDGVTLSSNDKILVKNQTDKTQNGLYYVSSLGTGLDGTWIRDTSLSAGSALSSNFITYVEAGSANTSSLWIASSTGSVIGSIDLYFINVFEQCAKVFPGSGIVDIFSANTEKPYYFRYQYENNYYVWAESTPNITYNNLCKISSPQLPDTNYGTKNKATYLATVVSSTGSTLYTLPTISNIDYENRRQDLNEITGSFQSSLDKSFSNHKHLGDATSPSQIDLNTDVILYGSNEYDGITRISNSVFVLKYKDGSLFEGNFDLYGIPKVYIDSKLLDSNEYRFELDQTPCKIIVKNSIEIGSVLQILLPKYSQKQIICIDSNGILAGNSVTSSGYVFLSDGTLEDRTPDIPSDNLVYKNFSWTNAKYQTPKLYIDNNLIDSKHYTIYNTSGLLSFNSSLPSISSYTFDQVKINIEQVGREIANQLSSENILNINANSFTKGTLPNSRIKNLSHSYKMRFKELAEYIPNKYLLSGLGNTDFYPENTSSDLQFNKEIYFILESYNFGSSNILYSTAHGLMTSTNSFTNIKHLDSWSMDFGRPKKVIDDYFHAENINYTETSYVLTEEGEVYYTSDNGLTWNILKLPYDSDNQKEVITCFDVSTDRDQLDVNTYVYHSHLYAGSANGLYYAKVEVGSSENDWEWTLTQNYFNAGTNVGNLTNINDVVEIVTKRVDVTSGEDDIISYDRVLYIASSDPIVPGLYAGDRSGLIRITTDEVKGIYWIQAGEIDESINDIIWWNDYEVYHTHSARFTEDVDGSRWTLPFTDEDASFTSVYAATTENITLSGNQTIDGNFLIDGDTILVKDQTNKAENGIYIISTGSWVRSTELDQNSDYEAYKKTIVGNGTVNGSTTWFIIPINNFSIGTSEIVFDTYIGLIYSTSAAVWSVAGRPKVKNVTRRQSRLGLNEYLISHTEGIALLTDTIGLPLVQNLDYDPLTQGLINNVYSTVDGYAEGDLLVSSQKGIYKSTPLLWADRTALTSVSLFSSPWQRTENFILSNDTLKIFDSDNMSEITGFTSYPQYQLVRFPTATTIGKNYYYERSFTDFYIAPWKNDFIDDNGNSLDTRVIVYVNDKTTSIPYTTNSTTGLIRFTSPINPEYFNNVKVTISVDNPFITDVGSRTHSELFLGAKKSNPIARLSISSSSSDTTIFSNQTVSNNLDAIMIEDNNVSEIAYVKYVNNYKNPVEIVLDSPRSSFGSTHTFAASSTISEIKDSVSSNVQDDLYYLISKDKYNLSSLNNSNTQLLSLSLKNEIATLYDISPAAVISQTDKRGLKNNLLVNDFINDSNFDSFNSDINERIEVIPSLTDFDGEVLHVFGIDNLTTTGEDAVVATNQGIWKYDTYRWIQIKTIDDYSVSFFKQLFDKSYAVGVPTGLYTGSIDFSFAKDTLYTQQVNDISEGTWNGLDYKAYAKNDGLVLITNYNDPNNFISEYVSNLDNLKVNGIYKTQASRIANNLLSLYDVLFLSTDSGFYSVCSGSNSDVFGYELVSRNILETPSGVTTFYKSFVPYQTPSVPLNLNVPNYLFILTDDGVLKTTNWKWADPTSSSNLVVTDRFLQGLDCRCFHISTSDSPDGIKPGKSKIFIGTNKGVYRSLDGGLTFEPTNRFDKISPTVYDLKSFDSTYTSGATTVTSPVLVACTSTGIWYSIDDGDNWYKSGTATTNSEMPLLCSYLPSNNIPISNDITIGNYLAQTFTTKNSSTVIDKVSVYLKVNTDFSSNANYLSSFNNNTISATLCSLDGSGLPNLSSVLATSTTLNINPSDIVDGMFINFNFNYTASANSQVALVIRETLTASGISIVSWKKSNRSNPYTNGKAFTRYSATWSKLDQNDNYDFYFKVHYSALNSPAQTNVIVGNIDGTTIGWQQGLSRGVICNDSGDLVLDPKFLISLIVDDSKSMAKSYLQTNYITQIDNLLTYLVERTNKTVDSSEKEFTAIDLWKIGEDYTQVTKSGFITNHAQITSYLEVLRRDGYNSSLLECLDYASVGMYPRSVYDLNVKINDETTNVSNVNSIVSYLNGISSLRLTDIVDTYNNKSTADNWDETSGNISSSELAREILLEAFSDSYIPIMICVTDGEDSSNSSYSQLIDIVQSYWNGQGFKLLVFGLSKSDVQSKLLPICIASEGRYFQIENNTDWTNAINSLIHDGAFNLFTGSWSRKFVYDESVYIKSVNSSFTKSVGLAINSQCTVEFRYSTNYDNFTDWISLTSGVAYDLNKKITNIEYRINMTEGWESGAAVVPSVQELYHIIVEPAISYLYTNSISTFDFLNEYNLTSNESSYPELLLEWGICRGDSFNWSDYESLAKNRNSILSQRQKTIQNTDTLVYSNLLANPVDINYLEYTIVSNGQTFTWNDNYSAIVYSGTEIINSNLYRIDNNVGYLIFDSARTAEEIITVTITENSTLFTTAGENTTTLDYRTYFSENGSWTNDENVVVLINAAISRNNYKLDKKSGCVTFDRYLSSTDKVTIFINHPNFFKLGLKVSDYNSASSRTYDFSLSYTELSNTNTLAEYNSTNPPSILDNKVLLKSSLLSNNNYISTSTPIYLDYTYKSDQNIDEKLSNIYWYIKKTTSFNLISSPNYNDRLIQQSIDLNEYLLTFEEGDELYVSVQPRDGFKTGLNYNSEIYTLTNYKKPYVTDAKIKIDLQQITNNSVGAGTTLNSYYSFTDPNGNSDLSSVNWYDWSLNTNSIYTGASLPSSFVSQGKIISFTVTPFNGTVYGIPVDSQIINIV
jgi:hypothetical protein